MSLGGMTALQHDSLYEKLGEAAPISTDITYYHLRSPPTRCAALYNPPPRTKPEKTYCECQILLAATALHGQHVAIYAIELQIYTTAHLTTVFVSKADSTGFLSLLKLARVSGSVVQSITSIFVSHTIRKLHRPDGRVVISLFARAQDQYLFPGSIENGHKHVLNDRQLIKWWCKTLQPVLHEYRNEYKTKDEVRAEASTITSCSNGNNSGACLLGTSSDPCPCYSCTHQAPASHISATAHLVVPGEDHYQTASFFPPIARSDPKARKQWTADHPLREIAPYHPNTPPRSLIPHFPDDPKSRFLDNLDEECADVAANGSQTLQNAHQSPSKRGGGQWKSVKTLERFWEMMAIRQDCSSGKLVGFLWLVFTPDTISDAQHSLTTVSALGCPPKKRKCRDGVAGHYTNPSKRLKSSARQRKPTGYIIARAPRIKSSSSQPSSELEQNSTAQQTELLLSEKSYTRAHDILLRLNFANLQVAATSTRTWVEEIAVIAGVKGSTWGVKVSGTHEVKSGESSLQTSNMNGAAPVTMLTAKKKPKAKT